MRRTFEFQGHKAVDRTACLCSSHHIRSDRRVDFVTTVSNLYGRFAEPRTLASRELGCSASPTVNSRVVVRPRYGHKWREGRIVEAFGCQVKVCFPFRF